MLADKTLEDRPVAGAGFNDSASRGGKKGSQEAKGLVNRARFPEDPRVGCDPEEPRRYQGKQSEAPRAGPEFGENREGTATLRKVRYVCVDQDVDVNALH